MKDNCFKKFREGYLKFASVFSEIMLWFSVAIFAVMLFSVSYGVLGRYLPFVKNPRWTMELSTLCLVWLCFITAGYAIGTGAHVRMTVLNKVFGEKLASYLHYFAHVVLVLVNIFFIIYGINLCIMMGTAVMPATGWPVWLTYSALAAGGVYGLIMSLARIIKGDL